MSTVAKPQTIQGLLGALKGSSGVQGAGWEALFDGEGRLIDTTVEELPHEPTFEHPLRGFYGEYAERLWGDGRSVFLPYEATSWVVSSPGVAEVFQQHWQPLPQFRLAGAREKYRLDPQRQKVGILTAGGNAPGLNTVIDSIAKRHSLLATTAGAEQLPDGSVEGLALWGYRGGYVGLLGNDKAMLSVRDTDRSSLLPGSLLGIQRGPTEDGLTATAARLAEAVQRDGLDILYVIGGDGTIRTADAICQHLSAAGEPLANVRVVAAPKTMDNDVHFTDRTFGFRTTVENAVETIKRIHLEAETCGRIAVLEFFGAGSGFVALHAAYASGEVDYVLVPEMMAAGPSPEGEDDEARATRRHQAAETELARAAQRLSERYKKRGHAVLVVAEGATAACDKALGEHSHGHHSAREAAFDKLVAALKGQLQAHGLGQVGIFTNQPKHLVRSTAPDSADVDLCKQTGKLMVDTALAGMSRCVVSLWRGQFVLVPMALAAMKTKQVDVGGYYYLSMMEKYLL